MRKFWNPLEKTFGNYPLGFLFSSPPFQPTVTVIAKCSPACRNLVCKLQNDHNNPLEAESKWWTSMQCLRTILQTTQCKYNWKFSFFLNIHQIFVCANLSLLVFRNSSISSCVWNEQQKSRNKQKLHRLWADKHRKWAHKFFNGFSCDRFLVLLTLHFYSVSVERRLRCRRSVLMPILCNIFIL